jgi:hypothetical protein
MKTGLLSFSLAVALAFFTTSLAARADRNPDFDDDAKPILRMQPGLLQYVESRFEVQDSGTAKYPGNDDSRPRPPYIFRAKPRGAPGGYNLRLLIQPGPVGHILGVVDITKVHMGQPPAQAPQQAPAYTQQAPAPSAPSAPANAPTSSPQPPEPTADTPSGPINDSSNGSSNSPSPSGQQSLAPPADLPPAP